MGLDKILRDPDNLRGGRGRKRQGEGCLGKASGTNRIIFG